MVYIGLQELGWGKLDSQNRGMRRWSGPRGGLGQEEEAVCSSETSMSTYRATRYHDPEDQHQYIRRENFKSQLSNLLIPWGGVFLVKLMVTQLVKRLPAFTEPRGSQKPATGLYTGLLESSPRCDIMFIENLF
jgi:hypothetical protein